MANSVALNPPSPPFAPWACKYLGVGCSAPTLPSPPASSPGESWTCRNLGVGCPATVRGIDLCYQREIAKSPNPNDPAAQKRTLDLCKAIYLEGYRIPDTGKKVDKKGEAANLVKLALVAGVGILALAAISFLVARGGRRA